MRTTLFTAFLLLLFFSCKTDQKDASTEVTSQEKAPAQEQIAPPTKKEFNWEDVPVTTADIGKFPYFTPPEGTVFGEGYGEKELDFSKLELYINDGFVTAEGRVKIVSIQKDSKNGVTDWSQYKFDSSFEKYMESIGAKLVFKGKIPMEQLKALNETDDMNVYNYVVGDAFNNPISIYAINQPDQKVFVQVSSNSAAGDVGVVKLAD